jgi:hypothetical protein
MSVTLTVDTKNTVTPMLQRMKQKLAQLPQEAYKEFVKNTPIRTGNAKRSTKLKGKTIEADYSYAQVLDKGRHMTTRGMRGSEQAPNGMTKPTTDFIKKRLKQIVRGR